MVSVRLTEVEAYGGQGADPGSHAFRGPGRRNASMFGPPGRLYVYFTYGMHWCANVVCAGDGTGAAVLLRAGEVVEGVDLARARRPRARRDTELARGPARLAMALAITGAHDGVDLAATSAITLRPPTVPPAPGDVRRGPRVGVSGGGGDAGRFPWRFWLAGEPSVSAYRAAQPRRRTRTEGETLPPDTPATVRGTPAAASDEGTPAP